ncbi:YegP family protein [Youhaiella tibetensis]|uniref:YegP family protein n=1 Tax=Paradevosia tibetensis TaxID=1447062 RepID=UPI001FCE940F|nr:YegP family protein [Youhaiella tibetensis]
MDLSAGETGKGYRFEIEAAKNGEHFVRFRARNGEIMVRSETYTSKASAKNAIESVKKNGPKADTVDESLAAKPAAAAKK